MSIDNGLSIEQEPKEDNILLGIRLIKEIAGKHEKELRELIERNDGGNIMEPINEGDITTEQLVAEFEALANERGLDLDDFYKRAGRYSFMGHRFEATTFMQIVFHSFRRNK